MEDMRDSTAMPQIVKMVVKFHPLLILTSLIYQAILLHDWIEEEVINQWKALKVYCQSTMRALLDPIIEKMKNLSEALQMHLENEAAKGQLKVKLIGELALFSATFLLLDTEFSSKYDKRGVKTQLLLITGLDLLRFSKLWSQLGILRGRYSYTANSISNFTFFILAIVFSKFYDNSLRSVSVMLFIAVFVLCLLIVLRPQTDLGLFSFIMGVIGSITYNHFEFTSPTWIIASICFVLFNFKSWLDKYWLDLEQDQSLTSTDTQAGSTTMILILLSGVRIAAAILETFVVKSPLFNYKFWLGRSVSGMIWSFQLHSNLKDTPLPSTNTKEASGLILIIINVAQGMFAFALSISPVANYKVWLFAVISYMAFCFWLQTFFPQDQSLPYAHTKGVRGMILSLKSIATYGIGVLVSLEPRLYYKQWLGTIIYYVLWWVQLRGSFPKGLLLSTTVEFKALHWWTTMLYCTIFDVFFWIHLSTTGH